MSNDITERNSIRYTKADLAGLPNEFLNEPPDEDAWIEMYLRGDEGAFEKFHDKYFHKMVGFLRECVFRVQTPDAEDLAMELELRVARGIRNFNRSKASFRTWLYTSARNLKIDYGRKRRRDKQIVQEKNYIHSSCEKSLPFEVALVWECLSKISQNQRDVLILTVMEGFTGKETAAILCTSEKSIEGTKKRALGELRSLLQSNKQAFSKVCLEPNDGAAL